MKKKIIIILFVFLIINLSKSYTQTYINSHISSNTHWTKTGSPYIITDTVIIFSSVTLTIDPGVIVEFNPKLYMEIRGTLNAIGTSTDSIFFTSSSLNPTIGIWDKLYFTNTWSSSLQFVKISYASKAIYNNANDNIQLNNLTFYKNNIGYDGICNNTSFNNCNFIMNHYGTYCNTTFDHGSFTNCNFLYNVNGILWIQNWGTITKCNFIGNSNYGLLASNCIIKKNLFNNNNKAIQISFGGGPISEFSNNLIKNNNYGMRIVYGSSPYNCSVYNNCFYDNSIYNVSNETNKDINMSNNYWGTLTSNDISLKIYDVMDNSSFGLVTFTPFQTLCQADTSLVSINDFSDKIFNLKDIFIFPNPVNSQLTVEIPQLTSQTTISIFNINGHELLRQQIKDNKTQIDVSNLTSGIYFVKLITDNTIEERKIIKEYNPAPNSGLKQ